MASTNERKSSSPLKIILRVILAVFFIVIQIAIYYLLFIGSRFIPHIYVISTIVAVILVFHLYNNNANISFKLTWTIVILLFNVVGPLFYLLFGGGRNISKRKVKKIDKYLNGYLLPNPALEAMEQEDLLAYRIAKQIQNDTGFYPYRCQQTQFYKDGALMFEAMIAAIDEAKRFIFMEYFIVASGKMLDRLIEHLEQASLRGVEIKILRDYVGCNVPMVLKRKDMKRLKNLKNTTVALFNPLGVNLNLGINYRDHRKVLLVDGMVAFVGGINIADEYIHQKERFGFWRDNGMMIAGAACYNYLLMFAQTWYMSTKETLKIEDYKAVDDVILTTAGYVFPFGDGPHNRVDPMYDLYLKLIHNAQKSIRISTPYFVIDKNFIKALIDQVNAGVEVMLLIPGIPDKKIIYTMAYNNFYELEKAGVKVYRFTEGFNHAKTLIVDDCYAVLGTANVDYRSMFLHFECCNLLLNAPVIQELVQDFEQQLTRSTPLNIKGHRFAFVQKTIGFILSILGPLV